LQLQRNQGAKRPKIFCRLRGGAAGLLNEAAGELQEGGFEVDFFFSEEEESEAGLNQSGGDGAVVFDGGFKCCLDDLIFGD
jgi:hypothetical protein